MRKLLLLLLAIAAAPLRAQAPSPEIAVIKVYEGMARYAEAAAADPGADRAALWRREVIEPYWQACAEGGAYLDYGPSWAAPFDDVAGLRAAATALAASDVEGSARAVVLSIGAGVNEEIVFRLLLLGLLQYIFADFIGMADRPAIAISIVLSALLFSGAHYVGAHGDKLELVSFVYRALAGVIFALIYRYRSFAVAVYTHAIYDIIVLLPR